MTYRFESYALEPTERRFLHKGEEIVLRPKTFQTLLYLIERRGHLVTRTELLDNIWPEVHVVDTVVAQCVAEIRQALGDAAQDPSFIQSVPKVGYRWIARIEVDSKSENEREPISTRVPQPSIAVLAFKDMSPAKDHDYFCEGIAEEIINALTRVSGLHVVARTSAFSFKGKGLDICEIGRALKVENVLEGSLQKSGNRLRIGIQLINAKDGFHLWSERFKCETGDVFDIQDQITTQTVGKLKLEVFDKHGMGLHRHDTKNPDAYILNLKGRYLLYRETMADVQKAIPHFEQAILIDPDYAGARAGLSTCWAALGYWNARPAPAAYLEAKKAAIRAVESDPESATAHEALTFVALLSDWDWETADMGTQRALELNPNSASAHVFRALYCMAVGKMEEAIVEAAKSVELDPLSNQANAYLAMCLVRAGKLQQAVDQFEKTLELEPTSARSRMWLGQAYALASRFDEGIAEIQEALEQADHNSLILAGLGWACGMAGRQTEARQIVEELKERFEQEYPRPYLIAKVYSGLGEKDLAFEWLERAFTQHDTSFAFAKTDETLANLRSDPRFADLMRRLNLET